MGLLDDFIVGMGIAYLASCAIGLVHPASFPLWVFDLCNIVFWMGNIILIGIGVALLIALIFIIIAAILG